MEDVKSDGMYPSLRGWLYMFRMTGASSCAKSLSNLLGMLVCKTYKKVINLIGNWSLTGIWLLSSTIRYAICRLCAYMTYSVRGKRVTVKSPVLEM